MLLCQLLSISKPIIQAPMAGVQDWRLAVAVSQAGALGSIPCGMLTSEQVIEQVSLFQHHCDKPYNLNFFCHQMPQMNDAELARWQTCLEPYYHQYQLPPSASITGLRKPFDKQMADKLDAIKPPVVSFHFGLPEPQLVEQIKTWGTIILSSATTVEEAIWLQNNGADVIIAQGCEAGGHRAMFLTDDPNTQQSTQTLLAAIMDAVSIPVIAAGGLATATDVKQMLAKGAAGVQLGTAYLLCDEATTFALHRKALSSPAHKTALTNIFSGRLARGIVNQAMQELGYINDNAPRFPYASLAMAPLRAKAESVGDDGFSPLWAGTNTSGCRQVSASELTRSLWNV
ncbi:NAD(P)H-dependent flavin oxidoreductase [Shewanella waksmanii]|uniref:NAD(P)H-dependent flavin oxidoreductase n=1 Tax=Shewanella waksmanii TaxID=213783 RepID=UPI003734C715